jgi:hypothetical protein
MTLKPRVVNSKFPSMDLVALFKLFFPFTLFQSVLLRNVNIHIEDDKARWALGRCCGGLVYGS